MALSLINTSDAILAEALKYRSIGWSVIPVKPRTKQPACRWKPYQDRRPTEGELHGWFGNGRSYGLAVILGTISNGLVCRDFDAIDSYERWSTDRPGLAETLPTVETHRGRHVYCRNDLARIVTLDDGELRGAGYCVLPPSEHPSGEQYRWVIPLDGDVPKLTLDQTGWAVRQRETLGSSHVTQKKSAPPPLCNTVWHVLHGSERAKASVLQAIDRTIPDGPRMRERRLFALARELRGVAELSNASSGELDPIVREWHRRALPVVRTKEWAETWGAFLRAWGSVIHPAGSGRIDQIFQAATQDSDEDPLVSLCRGLQQESGKEPFFLDCRTAGRLLGINHVMAWRKLRALCTADVLQLVQPGSRSARRASTYRFRLNDGGQLHDHRDHSST